MNVPENAPSGVLAGDSAKLPPNEFVIGTAWLRCQEEFPDDGLDVIVRDQHRPTQGWDIAGLVDE